MKRFKCVCNNSLFFESTVCLKCKREVGWCPQCKQIAALEPHPSNGWVCQTKGCGTQLLKCDNYFTYNVCNRLVPADGAANPPACDYCRFNHIVPDMSVPGNRVYWAQIEAAKRRCLYDFDVTGLTYGDETDGVTPPLRFDFKADTIGPNAKYRAVGGAGEQVFTGHDNGLITINLKEADPVAREKARIEFGEAHRTLVGHFRHEMGHYVWDVVVKGKREQESIDLFGDHTVPYDAALQEYYKTGPKPGWQAAHVSGYATMHPWEDFAETFANYLDLTATLETAQVGGLIRKPDFTKFDDLAALYVQLGLTLNELNRSVGLIDFLPEVIVEPVKRKMAFIHSMTKVGVK